MADNTDAHAAAFLRKLLVNARGGNDDAIQKLRQVCSKCAEVAPENDLIKIAEFLQSMHRDLIRKNLERN